MAPHREWGTLFIKAAKSHNKEIEELQKCFDRLRAAGLKMNAKKCSFGQEEVPYLGFTDQGQYSAREREDASNSGMQAAKGGETGERIHRPLQLF